MHELITSNVRRIMLAATLGILPGWTLTGTPPSAQSVSTSLETVYSEQQADAGNTTFNTLCVVCHEVSRFTDTPFLQRWSGMTADDLVEFMKEAEPQGLHGGYGPDHYVDLVAYFFQLNGLAAGPTDLPSDRPSLRNILIEWE